MQDEEDNNDIPEGMLVLVKGVDASGEPQYAYAVIAYEKYEAFIQAQAAGSYNLSEFGTILSHGSGENPPSEVQNEVQAKYGKLYDFDQQLMDAIKTLS